MSRTRVIAFANNKGGSGKTTSCSNIGCALSMMGKKVLLIDGDMQINLTLSFFDEEKVLEYASNGKNIYTALKEERDLSDFIVQTPSEISSINIALMAWNSAKVPHKNKKEYNVDNNYYSGKILS